MRISLRILGGLLLAVPALVLLMVGCACIVENAVPVALSPLARHLAATGIERVSPEAPVNPVLEGEIEEVQAAPLVCFQELSDAESGVRTRAAFLVGWRGSVSSEEVRCYVAPECRIGSYRGRGEDVLKVMRHQIVPAWDDAPLCWSHYPEGTRSCFMGRQSGDWHMSNLVTLIRIHLMSYIDLWI